MTIKIFADGADLVKMRTLVLDPRIVGFTTNPTLARAAGVERYRAFGQKALEIAGTRPVSIEVTSDVLVEMGRQAREIASWGDNAFVKVPVMTSDGMTACPLIRELSAEGVRLNVTAVFTEKQVYEVGRALSRGDAPAVVSVFAGRIADAGVDPTEHVGSCRELLHRACPRAEMLWASPRQVYDAVLAERAGCEIITLTPDLIAKLALRGKDLEEYSRETVEMFVRDAKTAGYAL